MKICIECNKEFEPSKFHTKKQVICRSDECKKNYELKETKKE